MDVERQAIQFLNPAQIPITTFDQPLFALAKFVQWKWPDTHGEKVHVIMLGGLHTEMALWNTLGDVLEGSGWTAAPTQADVASSAMADSYLKATHLTRTRHAHQVTLLTLHKLRKEAFMLTDGSNDEESVKAWRNSMQKNSATFINWDLIMRYETLILIFVRAHREKNFPLYVEVLEERTPLFFALDHVNYSRWMLVHIRDTKSLPNPIKDEFENHSHWVLSKTVAFRRWMLSGPEMARLLKQFEEECLPDYDIENPDNFLHHEQGLASQKKTFQRQVDGLCDTIRRMGNPFLDDFPDLVTLDSRNCADESVVAALHTLVDTGKKQYQDFVKNVIDVCSHSIHDPIKRNSLALFKNPRHKTTSKQGKKIKTLQKNVALFGQLYVSMQRRDGDLAEFFAHEIQSFPSSLSDFGKLHLPSTKSDLLRCLEQPEEPEAPLTYDCKVMDGDVVVHCLPTSVSTFDEYADKIFIPYLARYSFLTWRSSCRVPRG